MIPSRRTPAAALIALLLAAPACTGREAPVERPQADARRAWAYLTDQTSFGPRVAGFPGHPRQVAWMRRHLEPRAGAANLTEQRLPFVTGWGKSTERVSLLARFQPDSSRRVLLVAQWDTPPRGGPGGEGGVKVVPGANDNASGVAVLMELAELFRQQPPPLGVDLLLVDGSGPAPEGASPWLRNRDWLRLLPQGYAPRWAAVVRMVGDRELHIPIEGHSQRGAPRAVRHIWDAAAALRQNHVFLEAPGDTLSDAQVVLQGAGIAAVEVADFEYGPGNSLWRTPADLTSQLDRESLRTVADVLAEAVYREGGRR